MEYENIIKSQKIVQTNNVSTTYQNVGVQLKQCLEGKVQLKCLNLKEDRSKINNLSFHLKNLEKEG